jgi:hypothetical protein
LGRPPLAGDLERMRLALVRPEGSPVAPGPFRPLGSCVAGKRLQAARLDELVEARDVRADDLRQRVELRAPKWTRTRRPPPRAGLSSLLQPWLSSSAATRERVMLARRHTFVSGSGHDRSRCRTTAPAGAGGAGRRADRLSAQPGVDDAERSGGGVAPDRGQRTELSRAAGHSGAAGHVRVGRPALQRRFGVGGCDRQPLGTHGRAPAQRGRDRAPFR